MLLVAHNSFSFDMKVLMNQFALCNLFEALAEVVEGFTDSLPALKAAIPRRKHYSLLSFRTDVLGVFL